MRVLFISPGFPGEMPHFVKALAECGAEVVGLSDQPAQALPDEARQALADYVSVEGLWDESRTVGRVRELARTRFFDRVECLWEPGVLLAARLREALGVDGMRVEQAKLFRDKERMKQTLDEAGIRTPRHARCETERQCWEAAERVGFPLIIKPIAGAGSADTYRVESLEDLGQVLPRLRHVPEVSVEQFIEGEEFTFDTLCADGKILFYNVSWYRPRVLIGRSVEWTSPQTIALRNPDAPALRAGTAMGRRVIEALGFQTGYTHMEWFLTPGGEAVFVEIAARAPGALSVEVANLAGGLDTYRGWAEIVCSGRLQRQAERRYNAAVVFKRARGEGRIRHVEGLERLVARYRPHIVEISLLPIGAPRRNWKQTLLSDGHLIVRHPDLAAATEMADRIGTDLTLYAG